MSLSIKIAGETEKPIVWRLLQLYLYDFSEFDNKLSISASGLYEYQYFDSYWQEAGSRFPFLIRFNDVLAGFAFVRMLHEEQYSMAEFFIMRRNRRHGIGKRAAAQIFDMFPGKWETTQHLENQAAQAFWRNVVADITSNDYAECTEGRAIRQDFVVA